MYKFTQSRIQRINWKILLFGSLFFLISLSPFLGFGNIAPRYVYLASFGIVLIFVWLIQEIYNKFFIINRIFTIICISIVLILIGAYNVSELYRTNKDWNKAGNITNKLLVDFNETFVVKRAYAQNPVFYFVNVPIRTGDAWIFPVGLPDALWFTFQNEYLTVKILPSIDLAFSQSEGSSSAKVFEFDNQGNVSEVIRTKNIINVPLNTK